MKELEWQAKICKHLRGEGEYAKKWATHYSVGVPDLLMTLPGFTGLIGVEVKHEKKWHSNTARKIKLTPKQIWELNKINDTSATAVVLVVVGTAFRENYLYVCKPPKVGHTLEIRREDVLRDGVVYKAQLPLAQTLSALIKGKENE